MTKVRTGALEALRKLREQRRELDAREAQLKHKAAGELGQLLLECGAESFEPGELRALMKVVAKLGPKAALERLSA